MVTWSFHSTHSKKMECVLEPIGLGKHCQVPVDSDGIVIGRGDATNIWKPVLSRQHCHLSLEDGKVRVRPLGCNPIIVLTQGKTSKSYKLTKGTSALLAPKDRLALLPSGEYLYEVRYTSAASPPRADSPAREDTDDEDDDSVDAIAPLGTFVYRRVSSTKNKSLAEIDKHEEGQAEAPVQEEAKPEAEVQVQVPPKAPEDDDGGEPPAKKQKLQPPCKYGAGCTRKNPQHFLEYSHPSKDAAADPKADPKDLPKCKYGAGCTRKNPQHFKECWHPDPSAPADKPPAPTPAPATAPAPQAPAPAEDKDKEDKKEEVDVTDMELRKTRELKGVIPDRYMPEDELVVVSSGGGTEKYKMKFTHDGYYCTCIAWRYQNQAVNERTCKHLKEYLGLEFEKVRCKLGGGAAAKAEAAVAKKFHMPGVLLADKWNEVKDLTGWYISEKLDGVRAYWDGERFLSRNGNAFCAPDWFVKSIPPGITLDGELFGGRGQFQSTVSVVKSTLDKGWEGITYQVFDIPSVNERWEDRMKAMKEMLADTEKYIQVVEQTVCKGNQHIWDELKRLMDLKAEGLMMRQPGSMYVRARSGTLLKVKKFCDCEALVKAHEQGKGKHSDKLGALVCVLANGKQFNVGTGFTDAQRRDPPKVGAIVTVKYQELTKGGVPRFPVFLGERIDAVWPPK
eukprot:TRINITY_DN10686_c0_g1_i2.p1 TRINITY_DN10686_c0_g1~~TRINITY_DN10686_c0_g1_i2.p1  ORF type:complete len:677 (+),score=259.32 TRINITY_DN10686_c0_g1_i2:213-2243(+)